MPRVEQLVGFHIQAIKGQETDEPSPGELETVETWTLILTDRQTQDQIRLAFRREARDELGAPTDEWGRLGRRGASEAMKITAAWILVVLSGIVFLVWLSVLLFSMWP